MFKIEDIVNKVHCADCLGFLRQMPGESVDMVLTDPPYGINGGRGVGSRVRCRSKATYNGSFPDTREYIAEKVMPIIKECFRISSAVVITPGSFSMHLYPPPDSFGCFYMPASVGLQRWGFMDSQPIFYYGKYYLQGKGPRPCSFVLTEHPDCKEHPCAKPIKTWTRLLDGCCSKDSIILDPFLGSGTTAVAAIQTGRRFIGIEIDPGYCEIARKRIAQAREQQDLFRKPETTKQTELI